MIHAFRLGPVSSSGGTPAYVYVGLVEGGEPRIREAPSDAAGLGAIRADALGQPICCEPALAEAGRPFGMESAELPPGVLKERAIIAYELASGVQHGASKPDAIAAFLKGAAAFWTARSWEVVGPEERLRVAFLEGHAKVDAELSVVGGDGMRLPGVALCDAREGLEELARLQGEDRAEAALRLANLTVDMERDPAWAAEAIEDGCGLGRVPVASRRRGSGVAPMVTQDLLVAGALLEAIAAWSGLEDDESAVGEGTAQAAGMRVFARVRRSAHLAEDTGPGLTPVGAEPPRPSAPPTAEEAKPAADAGGSEAAKAVAEVTPSARSAPAEAPPAAVEAAIEPAPPEPKPSAPTPAAPAAQKAEPPATAKPQVPAKAPAKVTAEPAPLTPVPPAPSPTPADVPAGAAPSGKPSEGLLARVWHSLRGDSAPKPPKPTTPAKPPPTTPKPTTPRPTTPRPTTSGAPAGGTARPPPPPGPEVDDAHPFAPFARALRLQIPAEPPATADEKLVAELVGRVLETARATTGELVSFPAVALEIVERARDPKTDARALAGFIARDPALAADVVSIANSAAFRGVSEIESVHDAVARLGLGEVSRVASAVAARKLLDPGGKGGSTSGLFVRAVAVATAAAGASLRQRGARSDHVWLGGLLHDVGKALARQLLARLAAQPGAHLTPVAVGERVVERVHVEVGEAAIRHWALPAFLVDICAHHHDAAVPPEAVDVHLVRLTSALASLGEPDVAVRAAGEIVQSAGALRLGPPAVRALATDLKAAEERARSLVR